MADTVFRTPHVGEIIRPWTHGKLPAAALSHWADISKLGGGDLLPSLNSSLMQDSGLDKSPWPASSMDSVYRGQVTGGRPWRLASGATVRECHGAQGHELYGSHGLTGQRRECQLRPLPAAPVPGAPPQRRCPRAAGTEATICGACLPFKAATQTGSTCPCEPCPVRSEFSLRTDGSGQTGVTEHSPPCALEETRRNGVRERSREP